MIATAMRAHETIDEKRLFHGTSPDTVEAICKQNFDWRLHGKNATMYGQGSYFAVNASYSNSFARRDSHSRQFMFLAKVLVGSHTTGHSSYRRPPLKNPLDPASDLYDSCVDNIANPAIFVVFDTDQFYPEYIIQYSTRRHVLTAAASAYAPPQPYAAPLSNLQPQKGIRTAYLTSQQSVTAPSRPAPPSSQPLRSTSTYPSRPSSTVSASIPNGSGTRSSSSLATAAGSVVPVPQSTTRVATTSNRPGGLVTRVGHSSPTSASSSTSSSNPFSTTTIASSNTTRNLNHRRVSSIHGVTPTRQVGSDEQRGGQASAFNSAHSTPSDAKGSVTIDPPKKKKDCRIM